MCLRNIIRNPKFGDGDPGMRDPVGDAYTR
jgi:hypothetical protein